MVDGIQESRARAGSMMSFQAGVLASAVGTGLVYPITTIYLTRVRDFSYGLAGAAIGIMSLGAVLSSPVAGRLLSRFDARSLVRLALTVQACGALGIALAPGKPLVMAAMVVQSIGAGTYYTSLPLLLLDVGGEEQHLRLSARRYALNNAGIGVGAVLSGVIAGHFGATGFRALYLANAVSFALFAVALGRGRGLRSSPQAAKAPAIGYRVLLRRPALLRLLAIQLLVVGAGFAQLDSSLPLFLRNHSDTPLFLIGGLIAVNTVVVVLAQRLGSWTVERRGAYVTLVMMSVVWICAMLTGLGSTWTRGPVAGAVLVIFMILFSVGETLYAPAFQASIVNGVPAASVGSFSALASMAWTLAGVGAPALGILLAGLRWAAAYWLVLAGCCAALLLLSMFTAKSNSAAE